MATDITSDRYADQEGLRPVAEVIHYHYGHRVTCTSCPAPLPPLRAYSKDEGGNPVEGLKRRQWRCRNSAKRRRETSRACVTRSCRAYIDRALETIGADRVEVVRKKVLQKRQALDLSSTLIEQPLRHSSLADDLTEDQNIVVADTTGRKSVSHLPQKRSAPAIEGGPPAKKRKEKSEQGSTSPIRAIEKAGKKSEQGPTSPKTTTEKAKKKDPDRVSTSAAGKVEYTNKIETGEWLREVYQRAQGLADTLWHHLATPARDACSPPALYPSDYTVPDSTSFEDALWTPVKQMTDPFHSPDSTPTTPASSNSISHIIDTRPSPVILVDTPPKPQQVVPKPQQVVPKRTIAVPGRTGFVVKR